MRLRGKGGLRYGAVVCGPKLASRKGASLKRTAIFVDPTVLTLHELPDGWTLLRSGPYTSTHSAFGSGECGACDIAHLEVFAISPTGDISPAFALEQDLSGEQGAPDAADLTLAPDWSHIRVFLETAEDRPNGKSTWSASDWCLRGHAYAACGQSHDAVPPEPANFPSLRGG